MNVLTETFLDRVDSLILTEAFRAEDMSRVLGLIGRYLSKSFGSPARYNGTGELTQVIVDGKKYFVVEYFFANGSAMRIGFTGSGTSYNINRLDYWKPGFNRITKIGPDQSILQADYSITFDRDLSVMEIFPKVIPAIKEILAKNPPAKTYEILINSSTPSVLTEARKSDYAGMSKSDIVRSMLKDGLSKKEIYKIIGEDNTAKSLISKIGKELNVVVSAKVTPAGNKTEKVSPIEAGKLKKGYKLVPKYADEKTIYDDLDKLLEAVITQKKFNALIVTGSTGTGKTQKVTDFLKTKGLVSSDKSGEDPDYMVIKGGNVSAFALYDNLFQFRDSGKLILIDDADSAFSDDTKNNILKAALDSYEDRYISWETKNPSIFKVNGKTPIAEGSEAWNEQIEEGNLPNRFKYNGQIIIISNTPIYEFNAAVRGRSVCIDITIKSTDMVNRIETMIKSGTTFAGADKASMQRALDFMKTLPGLKKSSGEFWPGTNKSMDEYVPVKEDSDEINFRTYLNVLKFSSLGFSEDTWKRLAIRYGNLPQHLVEG